MSDSVDQEVGKGTSSGSQTPAKADDVTPSSKGRKSKTASSGGIDASLSSSGKDQIIAARGTEEGLVLRIDGRAEWKDIVGELVLFLGERKRFLEGGELSIEWLDRLPTKEQSTELESLLLTQYDIQIVGRRRKPPHIVNQKRGVEKQGDGTTGSESVQSSVSSTAETGETSVPQVFHFDEDPSFPFSRRVAELRSRNARGRQTRLSADQVPLDDEGFRRFNDMRQLNKVTELLGDEANFYEEEANARVMFGTLRSGQRVETPFSLVIIGDVNPGADVIAGGDIIVFGHLRGTAHAGAYDDNAEGRVIAALHMAPMQLRIGSVISRGSDERVVGAEIARIEDRRIVVEAYNPRSLVGKRHS